MDNKTFQLFSFLTLTLSLFSCDRVADIHVRIINSINRPINISFIDNDHFIDTLQTIGIASGDTTIILKTHSGILGRNEIPRDIFLSSDTFEVFKKICISIDTLQLKKNFRLSKEWTYDGIDKDLGVYTLKIDTTDVNTID